MSQQKQSCHILTNIEPSSNQPIQHQQLHAKALSVAQNYKRCEIELIEILEQVDKYKICYSFGYSSLYSYAADYLGLSKDVAAIFINVARKTRELPSLKAEIKQGNITVSKARRMTSVINTHNQEHWLNLAKTCSKAQLEKEVAKVHPKQAVLTKTKYIHAELEIKDKAVIKCLEKEVRVQLQVGISEELMLKLRRVQDVLSQKQRQPIDLETALEIITETYLQKEDPLRKAKRQKMRGKLNFNETPKNKIAKKEVIIDKKMQANTDERKDAINNDINANIKIENLNKHNINNTDVNKGKVNSNKHKINNTKNIDANEKTVKNVQYYLIKERNINKDFFKMNNSRNVSEAICKMNNSKNINKVLCKTNNSKNINKVLCKMNTAKKNIKSDITYNAMAPTNSKDSIKKSVPGHKRKAFTARKKHQVYLKYQGQCAYQNANGQKCNQSTFLEIHHKKPVSQGGTNDVSNLVLLCKGHHKVVHLC
ncbi:MAG: HNH endonuclease [Bdellovibrionales bacterium]|nr:HNH endonuclease [Bdellovibrionales bacterium]